MTLFLALTAVQFVLVDKQPVSSYVSGPAGVSLLYILLYRVPLFRCGLLLAHHMRSTAAAGANARANATPDVVQSAIEDVLGLPRHPTLPYPGCELLAFSGVTEAF